MMNNASPATLYNKLAQLERDVQRLKVEMYRTLPPRAQRLLYPEKYIQRAVRETRSAIWQKRYAKKVARVS